MTDRPTIGCVARVAGARIYRCTTLATVAVSSSAFESAAIAGGRLLPRNDSSTSGTIFPKQRIDALNASQIAF